MINIATLHKLWLMNCAKNYKDYHPEFVGFEETLSLLRPFSGDRVQSESFVPLQFVDQAHIEQVHNIAWLDNSAKVVYLWLKDFVEDYDLQCNNRLCCSLDVLKFCLLVVGNLSMLKNYKFKTQYAYLSKTKFCLKFFDFLSSSWSKKILISLAQSNVTVRAVHCYRLPSLTKKCITVINLNGRIMGN